MSPLATRFREILSGLLAFIATVAAKERPRTEFLVRVHGHLNRTIQRFEKLVAHWRNNTLPKQRHRPGQKPRANRPPSLPTGHAWLQRDLNDYRANGSAYQLELFLATPECAQLLAEVPRATRILRPLARALGLQMPGDPPPKPPKPVKTATPPPAPPPVIGIRVWSLAEAQPNFSNAR
jgi:hypothetical protein